MMIKKIKEILPLLLSCLVVLMVGVAGFSLTETNAALVTDTITPPPEQEYQAMPVKKIMADDDGAKYNADTTVPDYTITTGALTYPDPVFLADSNVDLDGEFLNDVFVAGNNVTVRGHVKGDVFAAGANVNIAAVVDGDVRVAGQNIVISKTVSGNTVAVGNTITLSKSAIIYGSLTAWGSIMSLDGEVGQTVYGSVETLGINGTVQRDVIMTNVKRVNIVPTASIGGNIEYQAIESSNIPQRAITGKIIFHPTTPATDSSPDKKSAGFWSFWFVTKLIVGLIGYALLGIVCLRFCPQRLRAISEQMRLQPLASFGWGILYFLLLPLVLVILAISMIGLPLSIVVLLITLLFIFLAKLSVGLAIGQLLLPKVHSLYGQFILGFSLLYLLLQFLSHGGIILHSASVLLSALTLVWSTGAIIKQWKQNHE